MVKILFPLVSALCWINALVIAGDGVRAGPGMVLTISLVVASIYALLGLIGFFVGRHLVRLSTARVDDRAAAGALRGLRLWLGIGAAGLGLVMLLSLTALAQRLGEGVHVFG